MSMSDLPPRPGAPAPPVAPNGAPPIRPPSAPPWSPGARLPSSPSYQVAPYGKRVGAWLIDALVILLCTVPAWLVLALGPESDLRCERTNAAGDTFTSTCRGPAVGTWLLAIGLLLAVAAGALAYRVLLEGGDRGQTLGKLAVGIRVADASGRPLGYPRALGRVLIQGAAWTIGCAWIVDYLWPIWDDDGQTLHDKAVGAVVIEARS
jgi:uncharacterized RDD family membrane protein YckC